MMNSMDPDPGEVSKSLIDKVRKLLAMAEGASNVNEADAFSRKAAELIAVYRIDPTRLIAAADDRLTVRSFPIGRGAYVRARLALLQIVAEANSCRLVWQAGPEGAVALVAGFASDLDTTEMLYTSLHAQASSRMAAERRSTGAATQRWRRSFLLGYANQVGKMLHAHARRRGGSAGCASGERRVAGAACPRASGRRLRTHRVRAGRERPAGERGDVHGWQAGQTRRGAGRRGAPGDRRAAGDRCGIVTTVDRGRAEVYAAELAAYDGTELEAVVAFDELVALADRVTSEAWWPARPCAGQARQVRRAFVGDPPQRREP